MSGAGADLYRRLSRVAARWPVDVARRNRDLGEHVRERVQRDFRNAVTDGAQAKRLVRLGEAELAAMERLCDNHFKKMYTRTADIATTNQPRTLYEQVLSNTGQEDIRKGRRGRPGFFKRLFGWK